MDTLKLHDAVVFLAAAGLFIPVVKRLRINPILGFLLIGLIVGPHGLAKLAPDFAWMRHLMITDVAGVHAIAELGVVFLLFTIGLELSFARLWELRRLVFGLGSAQIIFTAFTIGFIAWGFGNSVEASIVLGCCLALSSTAMVMGLLMEQGRFGTASGRASFSILLAQDIAVVPILLIVGKLAGGDDGSIASAMTYSFVQAVVAVAVILIVGNILIRPLFRFVGSSDSPELFMAVTLLAIVATAAATHAVGLSAALGAFMAGLLLAETEFRYEIQTNIEPFKGLLLGLFFMSVAMALDLSLVWSEPFWLLMSVIGLIAIKATIISVLARLFGFSWPQAIETGLLLGEGGEFAFVIVGAAFAVDLLPETVAVFVLVVVGATMFITPLLARMARRASAALEQGEVESGDEDFDAVRAVDGHVIIAGYGRTGQTLAALLDKQQIAHIALDLNAERVGKMRKQGVAVFVGDASRAAILERVQLHKASALAVCLDDAAAAERIVATASRLAQDVPIIVRSRDTEHAQRLFECGATQVVPEFLESALQLGHMVLEQTGLPVAAVRDVVEAQRITSLRSLSKV